MNLIGEETNRGNILIVDDTPANLQLLVQMLRNQGYNPRPVPSGKLALQAAAMEPPELILLDIMMPEMDGYEVCRHLKENDLLRDIPVIFLSALSETFDKVKAFQAGGVDYVTKPFQWEEVHARVETHLRLWRMQNELQGYNHLLEEKVQEQVREISESQMTTIFALAKLAEHRDEDTGKHLERVQIFCRILSTELSKQPKYCQRISSTYINNIFHASPLHDIGKVGIPDSILLKAGKLTPDEFEIMKHHAQIGAETLEEVRMKYPNNSFITMGIDIAHFHHEKWDGSGYPGGLAGEQIPLSARIMAVADVYDALRSQRCYKPPFSHEKSRTIILELSGVQFDPEVVNVFILKEEEIKTIRDEMNE